MIKIPKHENRLTNAPNFNLAESVPSSNAQTLMPLSSDLHQGHRVYIRERNDGYLENKGIFKYFGIAEAEYEP